MTRTNPLPYAPSRAIEVLFLSIALSILSEKTMKKLAKQGRGVLESRMTRCAATLSLMLCLPALAMADPKNRCASDDILNGTYVFTASGFTRPPGSLPGTPWVPKAILEVLQFNGDGTLSTPSVTVANPFGDTGAILQPGAGASGVYLLNDDCTGSVQFSDASNVTFKIYVDPPRGETIWMIQTNPTNNVFQGSATRVR